MIRAMAGSRLEEKTAALELSGYGKHVLLCTGPDCAPDALQQEAWKYLKQRIRELGLMDVEGGVFRSKADCLRVCMQGPIAVVYPDGVWYRKATARNLERILDEHVIGGRVVEELVIARNDLFARAAGPAPPSRVDS